MGEEVRGDVGVLHDRVVPLFGIGIEVVEFVRSRGGVVDVLPLAGADGATGPAGADGNLHFFVQAVPVGRAFAEKCFDAFEAVVFNFKVLI